MRPIVLTGSMRSLVVLALGIACGTATASIALAAGQTVTIQNFAYSPKAVTVNVGESVTWKNIDIAQHTATDDKGRFDTGTLQPGSGVATIRFTAAGPYNYFCRFHPTFMFGSVTVIGAAPAATTPLPPLPPPTTAPPPVPTAAPPPPATAAPTLAPTAPPPPTTAPTSAPTASPPPIASPSPAPSPGPLAAASPSATASAATVPSAPSPRDGPSLPIAIAAGVAIVAVMAGGAAVILSRRRR